MLGTPPALILSQDQTLKLKALPAVAPYGAPTKRTFNARSLFDMAPSTLLVRQVKKWFAAGRNTELSVRPSCAESEDPEYRDATR